MLRNINFLKEFENLDKMLHKIQELTVTNEEEADITLTTAHRSKGLEWETVMIAEDFKSLAFLANRPEELEDELNLLYVAATRSTKNLIPNDAMKKILATIIQRRNKH